MKQIGTYVQFVGIMAIMLAFIFADIIPGDWENIIAVVGVLAAIAARLLTSGKDEKGVLETVGVYRKDCAKKED